MKVKSSDRSIGKSGWVGLAGRESSDSKKTRQPQSGVVNSAGIAQFAGREVLVCVNYPALLPGQGLFALCVFPGSDTFKGSLLGLAANRPVQIFGEPAGAIPAGN